MSSPLNVIALISGGKDSLYSILHCTQNGHNVVALANLHPLVPAEAREDFLGDSKGDPKEEDDINSFMYQTVGYSIVPLYAAALDLPLYRQAILGTATQTGRYYTYTPDGSADETEDLIPLLKEVIHNHPDANAICSGAILSTYQRTRIESVALRLGLTPLSFLWQYPALPPPIERTDSVTGLLDDMEAAGCDARIIKTASGGVKESMLWTNVVLPATRNQLVAAMSPYFEGHEFWLRGAVLGEGGEYETLAINGPRKVWKRRIEMDEGSNQVNQDQGGTFHLGFGPARTVEQEKSHFQNDNALVRVPTLLDSTFSVLEKESEVETWAPVAPSQGLVNADRFGLHIVKSAESLSDVPQHLLMSIHVSLTTVTISNITTKEGTGAANKTAQIMRLLNKCIHSLNLKREASAQLSEQDIVFTTLLLDKMSNFPAVNVEYGKVFKWSNPPARVTVDCGGIQLQDGVGVSLSVVLDTSASERRRGLHVQSRSYWAPANIGPYSQAISVPLDSPANVDGRGGASELVFVAGQIPLVPHTMELVEASFTKQAILSLQHLWRVGQERGIDWWTHGITYLANLDESVDLQLDKPRVVWEIWRRTNLASQKPAEVEDEDDNEDGPDAWDLKHNPYHHRGLHSAALDPPRKPLGTHLHRLPNPLALQSPTLHNSVAKLDFVPPLVIAEVQSLPRSAPIEWHSQGLGSMPLTSPRIQLSTRRFDWGSVSHCTVAAPAHTQDDTSTDGEDQDTQESQTEIRKSTTTDFLTIQIHVQQGPRNSDTSMLSLLTSILTPNTLSHEAFPQTSTSPPPTQWTIAHGTAYVTGRRGWATLQALQQNNNNNGGGGWEALTVVPCRSLWGDAAERLDLAITLRRDSS